MLAGDTHIAVACSADRAETLVALASEHGPEEVSTERGYTAWSHTSGSARCSMQPRAPAGTRSQSLPFADRQFDLVICALAFCHMPELAGPCREFFRVLRGGGRFLLTDFHPDALDRGWRTDAWSGLQVFRLPNYPHHRAGYLAVIEGAGFVIRSVQDIPIAAIPAEFSHAGQVERWGEMNFCIVVDAQKA